MGIRTAGRHRGALTAALSGIAAWAALAAPVLAEVCAEDTISLRGAWGQASFEITVADDDEERARGLMFVEEMPQREGMLFVYESPRPAAFWMKNTLIPLDMLFVDAAGVVTRVHENAIPHDETPIPGGDGVLAVLEINGGLAEIYGITAGTEMRHPAFAPQDAAWPCPAN